MEMSQIFEIEDKYDLWNEKIDDVNLWPIIRTFVLQEKISKSKKLSKSHISNRYKYLFSPNIIMYHLKTFNLKKINSYDILFFTDSGDRYFDNAKGRHLNRLYDKYMEIATNPIILERSFNGKIFEPYYGFENRFFLEDSLAILVSLNSKFQNINFKERKNISDYARWIAEIYDLKEVEENIEKMLFDGLKKTNSIKNMVKNTFASNSTMKICFLNRSSYLGWWRGAITRILHEFGFKILEIQHGFVSKSHYAYNYPDNIVKNPDHVSKKYLPDYLLMFGKYWADVVNTPSKNMILGYPYLDEIAKKLPVNIKEISNRILIISQGTVTEKMVNIAIELSKKLSKYEIIFKLHPGEISFKDRYSKLSSYQNIKVVGIGNVYNLIAESAIIIGYNSTVLFESIKFPNKRLFILDNNDVPKELGYHFSNSEELISAIESQINFTAKISVDYFWEPGFDSRFKDLMKIFQH